MLERLVQSVDAWTKAVRQKPKNAPMSTPPKSSTNPGEIRRLPVPVLKIPGIDDEELRRRRGLPSGLPRSLPVGGGSLQPGVSTPRGPVPVLPQTGLGQPTGVGTVGQLPTRPTNPPRFVVPPSQRSPSLPPLTGQQALDRAREIEAQIEANDTRIKELEARLNVSSGPVSRGTPNSRGTLPYYQGHGPTKKFLHEQFQDHMEEMRQKYPLWFDGGGRAKKMPAGLAWDDKELIDWEDYVGFGGNPPVTAAQRAEFDRQQKLQMQQQRPDLFGQPGTRFRNPSQQRAPQSGGANPPRGYQPAPPSGPMQQNQQALDAVMRLHQQMQQGLLRPRATTTRTRRR